MRIIQRINSVINGEVLEELIGYVKKYKGCFNEVWLNTLYGYPSLEAHRTEAERMKVVASKLREAGIRVSMQLSNTLGHGQYMMSQDCSALVFDGSPVRRMVGHDGQVAEYSFCWYDRYFREYLKEILRIYVSAVQPEELWIDDDLRACNHAPVEFGCFCDDCMSRFNKLHGTDFTREALVEEFLHGDITVRRNYIEFVREGIASLTEELCLEVKEYCPTTAIGLQNGDNGPYTGRGHEYIFDTIYNVTKIPPMYRPGAGTYHDHNPNDIVDKIYNLEWQNSMLPKYVKVRCPEIENTPDTAMGKSMHGIALESTMNLANGSTDLSYAMLGSLPEPLSFYSLGFDLFSKHNQYWNRLSEVSRTSVGGGLCFATPRKEHLRKLSATDNMFDFNASYYYNAAHKLLRNGFPLTYTANDSSVYLLHPDAARKMSDDEISDLLGKSVLTDGETVEYLQSKGFELGFKTETMKENDRLMIREEYTSNPLNNGYRNFFNASVFADGLRNPCYLVKVPSDSTILGVYTTVIPYTPVTNDPESPFGYASAICNTAQGGTWAVMAYGLWVNNVPSTQRDRILNIIDHIGSGESARLLTPHQALLMPRIDTDGKVLAVSVTNCTIGDESNIQIKIRKPKGTVFRFMSQYDGTETLTAEETDDGYILTIQNLHSWSVGTIFCDEI